MSPDIEDVRVARREALPHPREGMRILNDDGSAPLARHPLASGGEKKTGLPGASIKNTGDGAWACRIVLGALSTPVTALQQF